MKLIIEREATFENNSDLVWYTISTIKYSQQKSGTEKPVRTLLPLIITINGLVTVVSRTIKSCYTF